MALGKKFLFLQHLIGNCGKGPHRAKITRIILCITTGTGSGIGAPAKLATTARMKLIVAVGFWVLIIQQKLHRQADVMLLKMIGKHRIRKLHHLNLADDKAITWEGRSCNNYPVEGTGRGFIIYGDSGTLVNDGGGGYKIFDTDNKLVKEVKS